MNYSKPIPFLLILLVLISCNKDDELGNQKEKMLTGKNWKLTSAQSDPPIDSDGQSITDIYAVMPSCAKDNTTKFNADGSVLFDEGPSKCDAQDPQTEISEWSFNSDKTSMTVDVDNKTVRYKIIEISNSRLKISFEEKDEDTGINHTITAIYSAQ